MQVVLHLGQGLPGLPTGLPTVLPTLTPPLPTGGPTILPTLPVLPLSRGQAAAYDLNLAALMTGGWK